MFVVSSRRRHTRYWRDWSSDVCSSDLESERPLGAVTDGVDRLEVGTGAERLVAGAGEYQHFGIVIGGEATVAVEERRGRSEERRVGKECRSRWSPYH